MKKGEEFKKEEERLKQTVTLAQKALKEEEKIGKNLKNTSDDEYLLQILNKKHETKIRNLKRATKTPYFARIDFKEKNKKSQEIYIGKTNIFDEKYNVAVADWRAPISSVYYDGEIGKTEYECPDGIIEGELLLKRQYKIEKGILEDYNDVNLTTNDELLQECLNEKSDNRLKNIVATIQKKQNQIIRANMFKPLIVQGVAGSGKTTVAIHRIAYLIYTYEEKFKPEEFLIIAPNKFFLGYIKDSLPDLGVDDVRQMTIEDLTKSLIKEKINIEDPNTNLIKMVEEKENRDLLRQVTKFKGSYEFKDIIDEYIKILEENILSGRDFYINDIKLMSFKNIQKILTQNNERYSLKIRIENLKEFLKNKIENNSNEIINTIIDKRRKRIAKINPKLSEQEKQKVKLRIFEEYEPYITELSKGKGNKIASEYIKKIKLPTPLESFKNIINNDKLMENVKKEITLYMRNEIKNKKIQYEDIGAILHLQYKIQGIDEKFNLRHIVIDEAQDFSEFQFYSLKEILNNNKSLTILGDIAQGIYEYRGTDNWEKINQEIFDNEAIIEYLTQSYRTTYEIMNEANKILENKKETIKAVLSDPVLRHGEKVEYIELKNNKDKIIIELIDKELKKGNNNVAVITKDAQEAQKIYEKVQTNFKNVEIISRKSQDYIGGITIVPAYYAKGLEFDSVIISDISKYTNTILDTKLLYVAYTRGMHKLYVLKK